MSYSEKEQLRVNLCKDLLRNILDQNHMKSGCGAITENYTYGDFIEPYRIRDNIVGIRYNKVYMTRDVFGFKLNDQGVSFDYLIVSMVETQPYKYTIIFKKNRSTKFKRMRLNDRKTKDEPNMKTIYLTLWFTS